MDLALNNLKKWYAIKTQPNNQPTNQIKTVDHSKSTVRAIYLIVCVFENEEIFSPLCLANTLCGQLLS